MAKGYWIAHVDVLDPERYKDYVATAKPAFERFGAKFLARGGAVMDLEGKARGRSVIIEFESAAVARACYDSPEYQAAKTIRLEAGEGELMIVEGA